MAMVRPEYVDSPTREHRCENCLMFCPEMKVPDSAIVLGHCHLHAPALRMAEHRAETVWPSVNSGDWCGEWKAVAPENPPEPKAVSIGMLNLRTQTANALLYDDGDWGPPINSISDLVKYTARQLLERRHFGEVCLEEVRRELGVHGLALRGEVAVGEAGK